jgi:hypothetical protein
MKEKGKYAENMDEIEIVHGSKNLALTEDIIKNAARLARYGNFKQDIRASLKIPKGTWTSWMQRGKKELKEQSAGLRDKVSLKAKLVLELEAAETEAKNGIFKEIIESDDLDLKFKFITKRFARQFNDISTYIDDETGEEKETNTSALDLIASKLINFLDDKEE